MPLYKLNTLQVHDQQALNKIDDNALMCLVYISKLSLKNRLQPKILKTIQADAYRYHNLHGVTGVLCYGNSCLLQCLEAEKHVLLPVLQNLFQDERHNRIKILIIKPIKLRQFVNWGVRLLFLERWLWSEDTKKQAYSLAEYLPLRPYYWSAERTERFLVTIEHLALPAHVHSKGLQLNAVGNLMRHTLGLHQAFLVVQAILSLFVLIAIFLLYRMLSS